MEFSLYYYVSCRELLSECALAPESVSMASKMNGSFPYSLYGDIWYAIICIYSLCISEYNADCGLIQHGGSVFSSSITSNYNEAVQMFEFLVLLDGIRAKYWRKRADDIRIKLSTMTL